MSRWIPPASLLVCLAVASTLPAQSRAQYERLRHGLFDEIAATGGITNPRVIKALRDTPRHEFIASRELRSKAYLDMALPIGDQQTISSPLIVAQMTQALDPQPTDRVLEIGTGSGYQSAVLSSLVKNVYTIEIVKSLGESAERTLRRLGYDNVHVKVGDGYQGWPEHAPFQKIIVTCSPEKVPQPLVDQLADGGLMVVPVGERYSQTLYLMRKKGNQLESEALLPTLFVPMTGKAEDARQSKPDPAEPAIVNGSFELEASRFKNGAQPGWYYERQVTWHTSDEAPDGKHYVEFKNKEPGLNSHLLQGFALDGRHVSAVEVSGWVKTTDVVAGPGVDEVAYIAVTLYDSQRRELELLKVGPLTGTSAWHEERKTFRIPKDTREAIFRVGIFGGTGTAAFDNVRIKKVGNH